MKGFMQSRRCLQYNKSYLSVCFILSLLIVLLPKEGWSARLLQDSSTASTYTNKGIEFSKADKLEEAIEAFNQSLKLDPNQPEIAFEIGEAYLKLGKFKAAAEAYQQAIRLKPNYAEPYNSVGGVYMMLGENKEAINAYQKAIEIKPDFNKAYNNLGLVYQNTGQYEESIKALKKAISLDSQSPIAYYNLGITYFKSKEHLLAFEQYNILLGVESSWAEKLLERIDPSGVASVNKSLNSQEIIKPEPIYPLNAKSSRVTGTVIVQITVDEKGNVTSARAVSGHPLLQQAAVDAAYKAKLKTTVINSKTQQTTGVLTYTFVLN